MKVLGYTVTVDVETKCIYRMKFMEFTHRAIEKEAIEAGADRFKAYRIADRLIQRERKAGRIKRRGKGWIWKR